MFNRKACVTALTTNPKYDDSDTNIHPAASFLDQQYRRLNRTPGRRTYTDYTNAIDTMSMRETLESVHSITFQAIKVSTCI